MTDQTPALPRFNPDADLCVDTPTGAVMWSGQKWNDHMAAAERNQSQVVVRLVSIEDPGREFADRIPAPRPAPTTRHQLDDARSHALEVERDDLRIQTGRAEADNRAMMRDRDQALAERDDLRAEINRVEQTRQEQVQALNAKLQDALWTAGQHATTAASLRQQRDRTLADLTDAGNEVDQLTVDNARLRAELGVAQQLATFRQGVIDRHRQELGAAGDVLAVVRDAAERIDRALATYDTQPGEPGPEHYAYPDGTCAPDCPGCSTPALGSPPPRAQDDSGTVGYEIVARALHRDGLGALVSGDVVASAVSTRPTLAEAVDELRRAIGPDEREG